MGDDQETKETREDQQQPAEASPAAEQKLQDSEARAGEAAKAAKAARKQPAEAKPPEGESLEDKLAAVVQDGEAKRLDPKEVKEVRKEKKAQAQGKGGGGKGKGKGKDKKAKKEKWEPFVKRAAAPRLRQRYRDEILPAMAKEFGYSSPMAVPRLVKITLNMGLGEALQNPKLLESAEDELGAITGQKPVITKARQSIAAFKLRQGQKIGCMVTLRHDRMYEFFDRLVTFALPRTRDFRGVSPKSFDGRGNFSLGIKEQIVFPEIDYDRIEKIMGLNVSIVTSARTDEEGQALLRHLGMPFRK